MKNIERIIESQYPPKQTNVLWFDTATSELKIYMNGEWVHADGLDEIATDEDIDSITKEELDKRQYFTIEATQDNTELSWLMPSTLASFRANIEWSSDEGANWHATLSEYDAPDNIGTFDAGTKIIFRHDGPTGFYDEDGIGDAAGCFFYADKPCYVYGNVMSLLFSSNFATQDDVKYDYALTNLFRDYDEEHTSNWVRFKEGTPLLLPATKLTKNCYACMFWGCEFIHTAPELPATTLAFECYRNMFNGCYELTEAPTLPATTLAVSCYANMFSNCEFLTMAPELPATELVRDCYDGMFRASGIEKAPMMLISYIDEHSCSNMFFACRNLYDASGIEIASATGEYCCTSMFKSCDSLIIPPVLSATSLANRCYDQMFSGCTALKTAPSLPASVLANSCYSTMFFGCASLVSAPELPATTLVDNCYASMFYGCTSINNIVCLATNFSAQGALYNWVTNVAETGTFTKATGASWPKGTSGIPSGWTVIEE